MASAASRFRRSSVSRLRSSSVALRAGLRGGSCRWAWRRAFAVGGFAVGASGGFFRFRSASAACRAARRLSARRGGAFVSLGVVLPCGCVGSASSVGWSSSSLCSPCSSLFEIGIERCWRVGFGSPALFFGGGLVGRCACDRSRCRVCFPLVPVSPVLGAVLVAVARSAGLPSVPSSLQRVSPGRPVSQVSVSRLRRLLGL